MATYDGFDVVVVPFPFSERSASKRRPALVVSEAHFNQQHGHLVLAMITTAGQTTWPSDIVIADINAAGLPAPSVVRLKLFTLDDSLIARQIGHLARRDAEAVASTLDATLVSS